MTAFAFFPCLNTTVAHTRAYEQGPKSEVKISRLSHHLASYPPSFGVLYCHRSLFLGGSVTPSACPPARPPVCLPVCMSVSRSPARSLSPWPSLALAPSPSPLTAPHSPSLTFSMNLVVPCVPRQVVDALALVGDMPDLSWVIVEFDVPADT